MLVFLKDLFPAKKMLSFVEGKIRRNEVLYKENKKSGVCTF